MRFDRLAAAGAAVLLAVPAAAQVPGTPRALGMGGAYVGAARGVESLFQNPANLALPNAPTWSAAFPTISVGAGVRGLELGDFADLVQYDDLTQEERDALLADIPANGTGLDLDLRAPLAALQYGRFAASVSYATVGSHTVNRSIVDLVLNGFDRTNTYTIDHTEGFRATFWDVAAGYGHRIGPVAIGATAHAYFPRALVRSALVDVDTTYSVISGFTVPTDIRVTYAGVRSETGNGFGLDIGAAMEPVPGLTLSAALDNVVNTMAWDDELGVRTVVLDQNDYQEGDPQAILDEYAQSETEYVESSALPGTRALATALRGDRDAGLPMTLRAGAAYQLRTGTTLATAFQKELDEDTPYGGMWDQQLSVGVQQRLPIITLRAGLATDMQDGTLLSGGLSLGPIHLGVAHIATGSGDDGREGWIATFGLGGRSDTVQP
ncbi:DUF5723 family protein [Longimicrobium sp.]|uniref:DUF5723 family protein n=1 Tax=Longimicrobium sp. TaxID=2029185 RepID=UPI002E30422B|nr:DUF5723 family protein [Longimicrobium sp.]HEX6042073.1 DUF5723 family protein [Longimicrobium sp.]